MELSVEKKTVCVKKNEEFEEGKKNEEKKRLRGVEKWRHENKQTSPNQTRQFLNLS